MNFLVSFRFFSIKDVTAFLKVVRSMYQRNDDLLALIDADLGDEYSNANSPNPSPGYSFRLMLLSI